MKIWKLKKAAEKKWSLQHPWIFSNDLCESPKGTQPGELIDLRSESGERLALGYGNPQTLIAFRTLSRDPNVTEIDARFFAAAFSRAFRLREIAGLDKFSFRLVFAESDGLPGLIIDRYRLYSEQHATTLELKSSKQILVVQINSAGMQSLKPQILDGLRIFVEEHFEKTQVSWANTAIMVCEDSKSRLMEGLEVRAKYIERPLPGFDFQLTQIAIQSASQPELPLPMLVDFLGGQKTGFFLDQRVNIKNLVEFLPGWLVARDRNLPIRVLDLCCYVGQWGTQLAAALKSYGFSAEVTLVDASQKALETASKNVAMAGGQPVVQKMDILEDLHRLPSGFYDLVICDPPAFIKKKKDIPQGIQAYSKLNREAMRRVSAGGFYVSCSCSGLFEETDFRQMLAQSAARCQKEIRWLYRGFHSADHPQRPEFPQGTYLKAWIGVSVQRSIANSAQNSAAKN